MLCNDLKPCLPFWLLFPTFSEFCFEQNDLDRHPLDYYCNMLARSTNIHAILNYQETENVVVTICCNG